MNEELELLRDKKGFICDMNAGLGGPDRREYGANVTE